MAYRGSLVAAIVNEQIEQYGMTYSTYIHNLYIILYTHTDSDGVLIVSVGLAQARPNYYITKVYIRMQEPRY